MDGCKWMGEVFMKCSMWLTVTLSIRCPKSKLDPLVVGNPLFCIILHGHSLFGLGLPGYP